MSVPELKGVMAGAGFFAAFQAEAWNRIPAARIVAVADLDFEKASAFARHWNIPRAYPQVEEMLAREKPDFLDIVTGPETHRALVELGARLGIPVICQKPMAPSLEDCRAMVETCERLNVPLLIHENWRWQPWYREIRRLLDAGRLGRLFHLAFRMRTGDGRGPEPYTVQPYFRRMKRFLVYETLVHFLDTFRFLGGEFSRLHCRISRINPVIAGEDCALIHVEFGSGANGLIDANRISGPLPLDPAFGECRAEGETAAIRMSPEGRLWITEYGSAEREHDFEMPQIGYKGDSVKALQEHFLRCLRDKVPCESAGRDYLRTVEAVYACYQSAETGKVVSLQAGGRS